MTDSHRFGFVCLAALTVAVSLVGCGGSPSSPSDNPRNILQGTWNGTFTLTRSGQPDQRSNTQWTFNGSGSTYQATMQFSTPTLPARIEQGSTVLNPALVYPIELTTNGVYACTQAAPATYSSRGFVSDAQHIEASFHGLDCTGSPYDGRISLSR